MIGYVRDGFPYLALTLPGIGGPVEIEFMVDTAFDGHLTLPPHLVRRLDGVYVSEQAIRTADGRVAIRHAYRIDCDWTDRSISAIVIEMDSGIPLLGVELLAQARLTIEFADGGEVAIEPL